MLSDKKRSIEHTHRYFKNAIRSFYFYENINSADDTDVFMSMHTQRIWDS